MNTTAVPQRAWVEQIMGLPISIHLRGDRLTDDDIDQRIAAVFAELRHVDAVLSPYRDDSDLSVWERGTLRLEDADPILAQVIALCDEARQRTDGWFDPRALPDPCTGEPRYDPSGLVKGWAVERAARHLNGTDGLGWCLNAGGDILLHAPADLPAWRIGIEHPDDRARIMRVVERRFGAVATSGTARRGAHIIDPHTRQPATAKRSATVTGPTLLWADVYATAVAAQGSESLRRLEARDGYEALMVTRSGLLRSTTGWPPS
jgi:FAD:protein FMN transferase